MAQFSTNTSNSRFSVHFVSTTTWCIVFYFEKSDYQIGTLTSSTTWSWFSFSLWLDTMTGNTDKTVVGFRFVVFCRHSPSLLWSHLMLDIFINGHSLTFFIWSSITSHCVFLFLLPFQLCSCCVFLNSVVFIIFLPIANLDFDSSNHAFWILKSTFKLKLKPIYLLFTMPSLRELSNLWNSGHFGNDSPIAPDRQFGNPIFVMVRHVRVSRTLQLSLVSKIKVNDPDRKSGSPIVMMVRHARAFSEESLSNGNAVRTLFCPKETIWFTVNLSHMLYKNF